MRTLFKQKPHFVFVLLKSENQVALRRLCLCFSRRASAVCVGRYLQLKKRRQGKWHNRFEWQSATGVKQQRPAIGDRRTLLFVFM